MIFIAFNAMIKLKEKENAQEEILNNISLIVAQDNIKTNNLTIAEKE